MSNFQAPCRWCGQYHGALCPHIRAIEYHPDGSVKRVEFHAPLLSPVPGPAVATAIGRAV